MPASETPEKSRWVTVAVCVLGFVCLYVFSTGPIAWCVEHRYIPRPVGLVLDKTFYFPLVWLQVNVESCGNFLDWYLAFWSDRY